MWEVYSLWDTVSQYIATVPPCCHVLYFLLCDQQLVIRPMITCCFLFIWSLFVSFLRLLSYYVCSWCVGLTLMSWCSWYQILTLVFCLHADAEHTAGGPKKEVTSHDLNEVGTGAVLLIGAIIFLLGAAQWCLSALNRRYNKGVFVFHIVPNGNILFVSVLCLNFLSRQSHRSTPGLMCHHWVDDGDNTVHRLTTSKAAPMWAHVNTLKCFLITDHHWWE